MKFLKRLRGRSRYHADKGDHWFLLGILGLGMVLVGAVLLY